MGFWRRGAREPSFRQTLHDFSRSLSLIVDPEELHAVVAAWLMESLGLECVAILLRKSDDDRFRVAAARGIEAAATQNVLIQGDGCLARWLRVNEQTLVFEESPGVAIFVDEERRILEGLGIVACVPLVAINRLIGIMALGAPNGRPECKLLQEDRELLAAVAPQAALAFENAALIREQGSRLKRLFRSERLASAGELAAGAAHEIRNPLASIRSAIQYLRQDYRTGSDRAALIDDVLAEADRIDGIVEGLLSFARPQETHFVSVNVAELLRQTTSLISPRVRDQGINLWVEAPESLCLIADPNLLKQLFLNVVLNAIQAMPSGGDLRVIASESGKWIEVRIIDAGAGIAPEDVERIFDPFFTTRTDGTGLGLSICFGIAELHGGEIDVDTTVGRGTTMTIRFPVRGSR